MRISTKLFFLAAVLIAANACNHDKGKDTPVENEFTANGFKDENVTPQDFPKLPIPGFNFPEDSTTLNGWISSNDTTAIYRHAWGIWAGLTHKTDQNAGDDPLLVFETWLSPSEMIDSIKGLPVQRSNRVNLRRPNQFHHAEEHGDSVSTSIFETVVYSPGAATHAISNKLFMATTLKQYAEQGLTSIPDFPNNAITIKPVFKIIPAASHKGTTLFPIATWHGTIDSIGAFPEQSWGTCVYIDIDNKSKGNGAQLPFTNIANPPAPTADATYNLDDFVHFKLNNEDAYYFQKELTENAGNQFTATAGDIAVLVGMHVTTKENKRWTWQTFWWAPDADNPPAPSSKAIADARPHILKGANRHYAMAVAYYMVNPAETNFATSVTGSPNYAFNPYLEAGFGKTVFSPDYSLSSVLATTGDTVHTYAGVRTNCMSCHVMATVNPAAFTNPNGNSNTQYVGNSYTPLNSAIFNSQLQLDFAWSIQGNVDTTGLANYLKSLKK
jgi:hypothetical protein